MIVGLFSIGLILMLMLLWSASLTSAAARRQRRHFVPLRVKTEAERARDVVIAEWGGITFSVACLALFIFLLAQCHN